MMERVDIKFQGINEYLKLLHIVTAQKAAFVNPTYLASQPLLSLLGNGNDHGSQNLNLHLTDFVDESSRPLVGL